MVAKLSLPMPWGINHVQKQSAIALLPIIPDSIITTTLIPLLHLRPIRIVLLLLLIQHLHYRPKHLRHLYPQLHLVPPQRLKHLLKCYILHVHVSLLHIHHQRHRLTLRISVRAYQLQNLTNQLRLWSARCHVTVHKLHVRIVPAQVWIYPHLHMPLTIYTYQILKRLYIPNVLIYYLKPTQRLSQHIQILRKRNVLYMTQP